VQLKLSDLSSHGTLTIVMGAQTVFAEEHWLLIWPHKLNTGEELAIPRFILYLLSFALSHSLLQPPWNQGRTGWSMTSLWEGTETSHQEQWRLAGRTPLQMRTITYNDEAAPWSRSSHLMRTRSLPSSDDSDDNFSGTSVGTLGLR
jgi:hypothetical protein